MNAEDRKRMRWSRVGLWLGGTYLFLAVALYVMTSTSKPDDGLEWLPFIELAGNWWYRINPWLLYPGVLINSVVLYIAGWLVERQWRALRGDPADRSSVE